MDDEDKTTLISISDLHEHEEINPDHAKEIFNKIKNAKFFTEPIIVDSKSLVILDGHHRFNSCKKLGLKKIPCKLVDYLGDRRIRVESSRSEITVTKEIVIERGLNGNVFPSRTSRHFIPHRKKKLKIPLTRLK